MLSKNESGGRFPLMKNYDCVFFYKLDFEMLA
jgi:hypothetical protein